MREAGGHAADVRSGRRGASVVRSLSCRAHRGAGVTGRVRRYPDERDASRDRRRSRPPDLRGRDNARARLAERNPADADLHTGRQLQWSRLVHLHRLGRRVDVGPGDGVVRDLRGERCAGRGRQHGHDCGGHLGHVRAAGQRCRERPAAVRPPFEPVRWLARPERRECDLRSRAERHGDAHVHVRRLRFKAELQRRDGHDRADPGQRSRATTTWRPTRAWR